MGKLPPVIQSRKQQLS